MGNLIGKLFGGQKERSSVKRAVDKVFYELAGMDSSDDSVETADSNSKTISLLELYVGVLLVYNEVNKSTPGSHLEPPSRVEVQKLLQAKHGNFICPGILPSSTFRPRGESGNIFSLLNEHKFISKTFDTNKDGVLDRTEFEAFVEQFLSATANRVMVNVVTLFVLVPSLVLATRKVLERLPRANEVAKKVPDSILATVFLTAIGTAGIRTS
eukprot:TRINITY_DN14958_c0_g1_i3.p2 TRINITY_DN14958_c0_g1~~TRINITY_DN14958_c0_g1_i3.p2  ORF type:complete len:212 (+),score=31.35 TRINITY_DN14958_c0_g1_i3:238-873(+)